MSRFSEITTRKGTRSVKWDLAEELYNDPDVLPMWVADMDFKTPERVINALTSRVKHGIFGYTMPDDELKSTILNWLEQRHNWKIDKDWITYSPGVIPSLHMAVQSLTSQEEAILIQTPVYPPFYSVVKDHHRTLVTNPLVFKNESYSIDFDDFEAKIKDHNVKLFILCNPHNPVGRVWTREELVRMNNICLEHGVTVLSDEIHADLVFSEYTHIPIAALSKQASDNTVTCLSPTKTFNLAGLQASYLVTKNEETRKKLTAYFNKQGMFMLNTLGIVALESAYQQGEEWLEELIKTLEFNRNYVTERLHTETDVLRVIPAEGTYLLWIDCRMLNLSQSDLKLFMQQQAKVGLNDGASFGEEGKGFMRMNIAAPKELIEKGVSRIIQAAQK
ncbi:pyridoxal phosphate-dependent aminotransferase [Halobacillus shinanisalinarum]|uniref:cysteine-S-conjugate beta-lyase n=1 Tax=Halobacillus shinanisalinarum TaxID=2932258 RepID=A0ABY4H1M3_9BACI|nr:MalY/PatB family protein [Halobacillus shinanisalinarum]UOQ94219.1 pyridoxal phosphate-dependent aminotransferase [Halobacillus shinanisalinarum]